MIGRLKAMDVPLRFGRALDFGCGLGRLTQALAEHFQNVDGVDISASMIEQSRALNRQGAKVSFHLNVQPDLRSFPSDAFDFVYSAIALQHTPANFQARYIADFARVLKPGGVACFQVTRAPVEEVATAFRFVGAGGGAMVATATGAVVAESPPGPEARTRKA